jgi:hypothetical protein
MHNIKLNIFVLLSAVVFLWSVCAFERPNAQCSIVVRDTTYIMDTLYYDNSYEDDIDLSEILTWSISDSSLQHFEFMAEIEGLSLEELLEIMISNKIEDRKYQ